MEEEIQSIFSKSADYEIQLISSLDTTVRMLSYDRSYIPKLKDAGDYLEVCWVPPRKDGKLRKALIARSRFPVTPG